MSEMNESLPAELPNVFLTPVGENAQAPAWIRSPDEILARLESTQTAPDELETALLVSEITDFGDARTGRLLAALGTYISANRFTADDDVMVVLCSAIRKYAINMDATHFNDYAKWLHPSDSQYLDSQVEMVLVKGVDWRLSYEPFSLNGESIDRMVATIEEVCVQYSSRRLLLQSNFSSTALEANVALILLLLVQGEPKKASDALVRARQLDPDWIAEMITDQLAESAGYIAGNGNTALSQAITSLLTD